MTHKSSTQKDNTVINWKATDTGTFSLFVSIVQDYMTFWVKQNIGTVTVSEATTSSTTTTTTTTTTTSSTTSTSTTEASTSSSNAQPQSSVTA